MDIRRTSSAGGNMKLDIRGQISRRKHEMDIFGQRSAGK
jgi:hypothetical protein